MKYFKITRTWAVKAETEEEARRQVAAEPDKHLESESVTRTEYRKPQPQSGWAAGFRDQLLGSRRSR